MIIVILVCVMIVTILAKNVRIVICGTQLVCVIPAFQVGSRRVKVVRKNFVVVMMVNANYVNATNVKRGSVEIVLPTNVTFANVWCVMNASTFCKNVFLIAVVPT